MQWSKNSFGSQKTGKLINLNSGKSTCSLSRFSDDTGVIADIIVLAGNLAIESFWHGGPFTPGRDASDDQTDPESLIFEPLSMLKTPPFGLRLQ